MPGLIHICCGDGKGKTTAAMGLAIRRAGHCGFRNPGMWEVSNF